MAQKSSTGISVGGSSILVIFVVLCLTTFATLSLVSANGDYRLTSRTAETVTSYYEADAKGAEALAKLSTSLIIGTLPASQKVAQELGWEIVEGTGDILRLVRSIPLNENQTLEITVDATGILTGAGDLKILRWQVVNISEQTTGDGLNIWQPGNLVTIQ